MSSSAWEAVTDRQDDRRALAEPQGAMEPERGPGPAGNAAGRTLEVEGCSGTGTEGRELQENLLQLRSIYPAERSGCRRAPHSTATSHLETPPPPSDLASAETPELKQLQPAVLSRHTRRNRGGPEEAWSPRAPPRAREGAWLRPTGRRPAKRPFPELLGAPAPPTLAPPPRGRGLRPPSALLASPRRST